MRDMTGSVVVGYDGSEHATGALEWAAAEAARRSQPLVVMYAVNYAALVVGPATAGAWLPTEADVVGQEVVQEGAEKARAAQPGIEVRAVTALTGAVAALVEASRSAELVVVGTRGHGEFVGALLGSVAFGVAAHSGSPVVVVRGDASALAGPGRRVVVGVDGSPRSDTAVDRGAEYAVSVGAELHLVTAWQVRTSETWAEAYWADAYPGQRPYDVVISASETLLEQAKERVLARYPALTVTVAAVEGSPARVIADASQDAGLVVVGARGRGDFKSLLLGSVSRGVIHHAHCPVEIVHH